MNQVFTIKKCFKHRLKGPDDLTWQTATNMAVNELGKLINSYLKSGILTDTITQETFTNYKITGIDLWLFHDIDCIESETHRDFLINARLHFTLL